MASKSLKCRIESDDEDPQRVFVRCQLEEDEDENPPDIPPRFLPSPSVQIPSSVLPMAFANGCFVVGFADVFNDDGRCSWFAPEALLIVGIVSFAVGIGEIAAREILIRIAEERKRLEDVVEEERKRNEDVFKRHNILIYDDERLEEMRKRNSAELTKAMDVLWTFCYGLYLLQLTTIVVKFSAVLPKLFTAQYSNTQADGFCNAETVWFVMAALSAVVLGIIFYAASSIFLASKSANVRHLRP